MPKGTANIGVVVAGLEAAVTNDTPVTLSAANASMLVDAIQGLGAAALAGGKAEELLASHEADSAVIGQILAGGVSAIEARLPAEYAREGFDLEKARAARAELQTKISQASGLRAVLDTLLSAGKAIAIG